MCRTSLRGLHATLVKLHIYTMNNVGGISMYLARDQLHRHDCYLLRQTVQDYARSVDTSVPDTYPVSNAKETVQLTLSTQVLRLGVA